MELPDTAPGSAATVYVPGSSVLDGAFAAVLTSSYDLGETGSIASLARTDWPITGGAAIYSNAVPDNGIVLPLAVGAYYGQSSVITIHNAETSGPADARVLVEFVASGATSPTLRSEYMIPAGTGLTLDLARDPASASLGARFLGTMFASSATPVAVGSFVHNQETQRAA